MKINKEKSEEWSYYVSNLPQALMEAGFQSIASNIPSVQIVVLWVKQILTHKDIV